MVGSARRLRLGTRGSRLALVQSELVADRLRKAGYDVDLVPIVTEGDVRPVDMSPGEGVFVAAIARALINGEIDIAVHSAKDVPLDEDAGLVIGAYPERADPRDVLITRSGRASLESLAQDAVVGTDSPRRRSEEHTSELQSLAYLVCRLLLEKKKKTLLPTRPIKKKYKKHQ